MMSIISSKIGKIISILSCVLVGTILFVNVICGGLSYSCKRIFGMNNIGLLLIGIMVVIIITRLGHKESSINNFKNNNIVITILAFALCWYIGRNIFFSTGWDAKVVMDNAMWLAQGKEPNLGYFSTYSNNLFFLFLEKQLAFVFNLFGVTEKFDLWLLGVQCLVASFTGTLLYNAVYECTFKRRYALGAWGVYFLLIGLSGWVCIPYTDIYGMFFSIAIIRLVQCILKNEQKLIYYIAIASLAYFGFRIKPQVLIVFIAIVIIAVLHYKCGVNNLKYISVVVIALLTCHLIYILLISTLHMDIDKNQSFGPWHMVMMGLNADSNGVYNELDVEFSRSFENKELRDKANQEEAIKRIKEYGLMGLAKHQVKKTLVVFNDGTFAWEQEGSFYNTQYDDVNNFSSPLFKNILYSDGDYFIYYATIRQLLWLLILFMCIFSYKKENIEIQIALLSIVGFIIFEELFEARARYVICFIPIFIFVAAAGMSNLANIISYCSDKISRTLTEH